MREVFCCARAVVSDVLLDVFLFAFSQREVKGLKCGHHPPTSSPVGMVISLSSVGGVQIDEEGGG